MSDWRCQHCGLVNGPEAVYCTECGERGEEPAGGDQVSSSTLVHASADEANRSTLVGSSTGVAPSLLDHRIDLALAQPLPRKVRISLAGWTALVGGWPELSLCALMAPIVAFGVYVGAAGFIGAVAAAFAAAGVALFLLLGLLFGMGETSRTLKCYRLARSGWAAGGEIARRTRKQGKLGSAHFVEFTFTDARGVRQRGVQEVSSEQWKRLSERDAVIVLYRPEKPEDCVLYQRLHYPDPEHPDELAADDLLGIVVVPPSRPELPAAEGGRGEGVTD